MNLTFRLILIFSATLLCFKSYSQTTFISVSKQDTALIQIDKMNFGYLFLENPFSIHSSYEMDELEVSASNGVVTHIEGNRFHIKEDSLRSSTIQVRLKSKNSKGKLLTEQIIRFKQIPLPIARIQRKNGEDSISLKELRAAVGVRVVMLNFDFDMTCSVVSFRCEVISSDGIYTDLGTINGNVFSAAVKQAFQKPLKKVIISEITCSMPGGPRATSPIVLDVID